MNATTTPAPPPAAIDHEYTREIVCPYCGYEFDCSWDYTEEGEVNCHSCGDIFLMERHVTVEYSTKKIAANAEKQS